MTTVFLGQLTKRSHLLFISLIWIILAVVINPYGEFPYNDDWAYAYSVKALVETGRFVMSAWTAVNLLPQIGWGALFCLPFGFSFTSLRLSTLVAGLFGLWGTYSLIESATENRKTAFLGTLLMLVNPLYLGLSASFMTDVPFYVLAVWSLSYLVTGLKQDSVRLMLIGLGFAVVALLIRQLGIAFFAAFALAYLVRKGIQVRSVAVAGASVIVGLGIQVAYQRWLLYMMPGMVSYNVQASNFFHLGYYRLELLRGFINNLFVALMYTGLFMFPYFLTLLTQKSLTEFRKNRWLWLLSIVLVLAVWQLLFDRVTMPIWFNTITVYGLGPILLRDVYYRLYGIPVSTILQPILFVVTLMSLIGSVCLLYYLIGIIKHLVRSLTSSSRDCTALLLFSFLGIYFFSNRPASPI